MKRQHFIALPASFTYEADLMFGVLQRAEEHFS
jgi:hypothetical protein